MDDRLEPRDESKPFPGLLMDTIATALVQYQPLVKNISYSTNVMIDPILMLSIVYQESRAKPYITRYEPKYGYLYMPLHYANKLFTTMETEVEHQKTSWGLCQIMGGVARELGFDDYMPALCIPATNLYFGGKLLSRLQEKYESIDDVISSYNAGSPRKNDQGLYLNQEYVDSVKGYMTYLRGKGF